MFSCVRCESKKNEGAEILKKSKVGRYILPSYSSELDKKIKNFQIGIGEMNLLKMLSLQGGNKRIRE
jgi:hypothetical protein